MIFIIVSRMTQQKKLSCFSNYYHELEFKLLSFKIVWDYKLKITKMIFDFGLEALSF